MSTLFHKPNFLLCDDHTRSSSSRRHTRIATHTDAHTYTRTRTHTCIHTRTQRDIERQRDKPPQPLTRSDSIRRSQLFRQRVQVLCHSGCCFVPVKTSCGIVVACNGLRLCILLNRHRSLIWLTSVLQLRTTVSSGNEQVRRSTFRSLPPPELQFTDDDADDYY